MRVGSTKLSVGHICARPRPEVGDRVMMICEMPNAREHRVGTCGTVLRYGLGMVAIRFDADGAVRSSPLTAVRKVSE